MRYLAIVSLLWAFSFGLIGSALTGVDPYLVASIRLGCALLLLLPFLRLRQLARRDCLQLFGYGAIQFGLMYVCYIKAFQFLPSHLVALFSVFTPLYVVLIYDLRRRKFTPAYLGTAALSVVGAAIIKAKDGSAETLWIGFALMQLSGLAFAYGQVSYRDWKQQHAAIDDHQIFALLYAGGTAFALLVSLALSDWSRLPSTVEQWQALLYLGLVASGLGFFLWNKGAARSRPDVLAAFNNVVVPLAVLCSLFIFDEARNSDAETWLRLLLGGGCIGGALWISQRKAAQR